MTFSYMHLLAGLFGEKHPVLHQLFVRYCFFVLLAAYEVVVTMYKGNERASAVWISFNGQSVNFVGNKIKLLIEKKRMLSDKTSLCWSNCHLIIQNLVLYTIFPFI